MPIDHEMRSCAGANAKMGETPVMQLLGEWHLTPVKPPGVKIVMVYIRRFLPHLISWFPFFALWQITHPTGVDAYVDPKSPTGSIRLMFFVPRPISSPDAFVTRVVLVDNLGYKHTSRTVIAWPAGQHDDSVNHRRIKRYRAGTGADLRRESP